MHRDGPTEMEETSPPPTRSAVEQETGGGEDAKIKLRSMVPSYVSEQHGSYVRHLEEALGESKNKNIALTGRYGSGKSSILDALETRLRAKGSRLQAKKCRVLRISINTLGPSVSDGAENDLTNRIQKELVKQLIYRAAPGKVKRSRFARRSSPKWWGTLLFVLSASLSVATVLMSLGFRVEWLIAESLEPWGSFFIFSVMSALTLWLIKRAIGYPVISRLAFGQASITFDDKEGSNSYFDEYLDEIFAFFEATRPDVVILEDLDRFDEPRIFDSLRELNTLLNSSASWGERGKSIQFIYAIKDSLFEQIGGGVGMGGEAGQDIPPGAEVEVSRSNRTKFFDVVIPVIPFLAHNNSRDLLLEVMKESGVGDRGQISRRLISLVARYVTDMRLMINICNEYLVFAERLLWVANERRAPGITGDNLFALVVYKNFHLADFELLPQRASALDRLESVRKQLVRESLKKLSAERDEVKQFGISVEERGRVAQELGKRLRVRIEAAGLRLFSVNFGAGDPVESVICTPEFWDAVCGSGNVSLEVACNHGNRSSLDSEGMLILVAEGREKYHWWNLSLEEREKRLRDIDLAAAALRGASYSDLVEEREFKWKNMSFEQHLKKELQSELACELVRQGFIDRYYAEYSTYFYGGFLGLDVANFFRNSIWPNEMDVDAEFSGPDAVDNILEQAPEGFLSSRSVLNVQIVDRLIEGFPEKRREVVDFMISERSESVVKFFTVYLNHEKSRKDDLVSLLACLPWGKILKVIASPEVVPNESSRIHFMDVVLDCAAVADVYDFDDNVKDLLSRAHADLKAFTDEREPERAAVVLSFVKECDFEIPDLALLSKVIRETVVREGLYSLSAPNLCAALELDAGVAPTIDRILPNEHVWRRCAKDIDAYISEIEKRDQISVEESSTLEGILQIHADSWGKESVFRLLKASSEEACILDIQSVSEEYWPLLVEAKRLAVTVPNIHGYRERYGIDDRVASLLVSSAGDAVILECADQVDKGMAKGLRKDLLSADVDIDPKVRVDLAAQLTRGANLDPVKAVELGEVPRVSLVDALREEVISDTSETFEHFLWNGWENVAEAFSHSRNVLKFISLSLLAGYVSDFLCDSRVPEHLKEAVVDTLESYSEDDAPKALEAALVFANRHGIVLPAAQLEHSALHVESLEPLLEQLANPNQQIDGREVLSILGSLQRLRRDFAGFGGDAGHEFWVESGGFLESVLKRLKGAKVVELPGRRRRQGTRLVRIV